MSSVLDILKRMADAERKARVNPSTSVEEWLKKLKEPDPRPCSVCGTLTDSEFYGYFCCYPYDNDGNIVKKCKWILRDRTAP